MNMDVVIAIIASFVIWNCWAIVPAAGATIDDETGLMNVNSETMIVETHFFLYVQLQAYLIDSRNGCLTTHLRGLAGSSGPSQSTNIVSPLPG